MCACLNVCAHSQTDSHPLELLVGSKGSCWDTFNQVLLQTTVERERGREREGKRGWEKRVSSSLINLLNIHFIKTLIQRRFPPLKHEMRKSAAHHAKLNMFIFSFNYTEEGEITSFHESPSTASAKQKCTKRFKRWLFQSTSTQYFCRLLVAMQQEPVKVAQCEMLTWLLQQCSNKLTWDQPSESMGVRLLIWQPEPGRLTTVAVRSASVQEEEMFPWERANRLNQTCCHSHTQGWFVSRTIITKWWFLIFYLFESYI